MQDTFIKLFNDIDYFADCASKVDIRNYKDILRSKTIYANDSSEQGAYFCAISKQYIKCFETAIPILLINSLYEFEEWSKDENISEKVTMIKWKKSLKDFWIPDYFHPINYEPLSIDYKQVDYMENLPISDKLLALVVTSPIILTVRYGKSLWNSCNHFIETETEYIDFQSWTIA